MEPMLDEERAMPNGKPNILFIMADDIGWFNVSAYNLGIMGYRTPNIDKIAREGALFTDFYGQQSCTAGRAAFITGQAPIRTGLTKVGAPGATLGLSAEDPTVAQFLKHLGYTTGQFGKNHLGDRNEHLPTVHGFDEFFGNLYHLNAEEEPEYADYPKDPAFRKRFGPRGVMKCKASDTDDPTIDEQFGRVGKQVIENPGPLTRKRMETVDEEFVGGALDFMDRKTKEGGPWFCYFNPTRMHVFTHLKPSSVGKTGHGLYPDGMVELDGLVGQLLAKLGELGVADDTAVVFTTDNGAEVLSWPDGGATPFRGEKDTNWEGGWRVPCVMRWPRRDRAWAGDQRHLLAAGLSSRRSPAAAGEHSLVEKVKSGYAIGDKTFKLSTPMASTQAALPVGQGRRLASYRLPLLERRRGLDGPADEPVEDRVQRAAQQRPRRLARTPLAAAHPQVLRPSRRPVRTRRRELQVQRLVRRARAPAVRGAGACSAMAGNLQDVPTPAEGRELHDRPDRRGADA